MAVDTNHEIYSSEARRAELYECAAYFTNLWNQRVNDPAPGSDLISMLAHSDATRHMPPMEFLGNVILLIVGGNDTMRNSISGGVLALNQNPDQYQKLRENPALIESMVPEIIRWQTSLSYMRRTTLENTEPGGQHIKKGDKVLMWYARATVTKPLSKTPTPLLSIVRGPASICHSVLAFTVAWATGWRSRCAQRVLRRNRFLKNSLDGYSSKR